MLSYFNSVVLISKKSLKVYESKHIYKTESYSKKLTVHSRSCKVRVFPFLS